MANCKVGAVVIGRNEGERLRECLVSIIPQVDHVVYVDSGSDDGSIALAKSLGVEVVELDTALPFTAARARNVGWKHLLELFGDLQFVQFVDGDCVLKSSWISHACEELDMRPEIAVISGHVREEWPKRNCYHRLAAMEWDTPVGLVRYCGGIALMRLSALVQIGGFKDSLIAGEEPELCVRLRQSGWSILKIDAEMASHDINISSFRQWWRRVVRSGYAYAEGASLHGASIERHWVKECRSIWLWGIIIPLIGLLLAWPTKGVSLVVVVGLYLLLFAKIVGSRFTNFGDSFRDAVLYAFFCIICKWPQAIGMLKFMMGRFKGRRVSLIEYASN